MVIYHKDNSLEQYSREIILDFRCFHTFILENAFQNEDVTKTLYGEFTGDRWIPRTAGQ